MKGEGRRLTYLCYLRIAGEETPVDVGAVACVGVVTLGCCGLQDLLHQTLCLVRFF